MQLGVFRFGLLQNWHIGAGAFPQFKEVLESLFGVRRVAPEREGARQTEVGKRRV